jgi:hypothetical protein
MLDERALPRPTLLRLDWARERAFAIGVGTCTAGVLAFLLVQLTAWPPHEDETLALFVGRESLGRLFHTVLGQRGGAPLHFVLAWIVAHSGGGLVELRLLSAVFAAASVPAIAALTARLGGRGVGLTATALASASWILLFHGVYGRMYSLFLFTSALSYLALLTALERGGRRSWALWVLAALFTAASHPYGAIVIASQALYVVLAHRTRVREAAPAFGLAALLGIPFWRSDIVLAGRFDVGVGPGGQKLGSPGAVARYFWDVAGDFTAGYAGALVPVLLLAAVGAVRLARSRHASALLVLAALATPAVVLTVEHAGSSASPESRHLIFALPFFTLLVAAGLAEVASRVPRVGPVVVAAGLVALVPAEVAWGWQKTPALYTGEPGARIVARHDASAWLARTAQRNDVLFGYDPLFLQAWQRDRKGFPSLVLPRADAKLALRALEHAPKPLGRGIWVFDASDTNNKVQHLRVQLRVPEPRSQFEARAYGPFLIIRTRRPTRTPRNYLQLARRAELVGKSLDMGDADVNLDTVLRASAQLATQSPSSRSTVSR